MLDMEKGFPSGIAARPDTDTAVILKLHPAGLGTVPADESKNTS